MKKILIIAPVAIVLLVGLLYFLLPGSSTETPSGGEPSENNAASPVITAQSNTIPLSPSVVFPSVYGHNDGSIVFYSHEGAWKVKLAIGATPEALSEIRIDDLQEVVWSPDGDEVITTRQSDITRSIVFFDYKTAHAQAIIPSARAIVWSPGGNDIAYQEKNDETGANQIVRASARGENARILFKTRVDLWRLYWPIQDRMYVVSVPSGLAQGTLFTLAPQDGTLTKLFAANGLIVLPSPDGKRILYSSTNDRGANLTLHLFDADATPQDRDLTAEFGIRTLAEKCVWSKNGQTIICAAFGDNSPSAIMPDDYYKGVYSSHEMLFTIDFTTGERTIADLDANISPTHPVLNSTGSWLVFINKGDGRLYSIQILNPKL